MIQEHTIVKKVTDKFYLWSKEVISGGKKSTKCSRHSRGNEILSQNMNTVLAVSFPFQNSDDFIPPEVSSMSVVDLFIGQNK